MRRAAARLALRSKNENDPEALTEPEIARLFLGYVGCRPGELCCIRRDDLDVAGAQVAIRFSLDGQGGEKPPKNGRARFRRSRSPR